jgi:cytochrome c2
MRLLSAASARSGSGFPCRVLAAAAALALVTALGGCKGDRDEPVMLSFAGNPHRGAKLIGHYGCGSCHSIPGIDGAKGLVGPPLTHFARRVYVAGLLRNTPDNLVAWIEHPQAVVPGNVMPDMNIDARDAHDIAAYLYTIQ